MSRNSFGFWGMRASRDEFSCALAALGILGIGLGEFSSPRDIAASLGERQTEGVLNWDSFFLTRMGRIAPAISKIPAEVLAKGWKEFVATSNAPIQIQILSRGRIDPIWVLGELTRPIVGAASAYLWKPMLSDRTRWHWPVRLGFLSTRASKAITREIIAQIRREQWAQPLVQFVNIVREGQCDLLVSTMSLRSSLRLLLERESSFQADCAILLDTIGSPPARTLRLIDSIDGELRTNAIVLANPTTGQEAAWFLNFLRNLSHNEPFDVALTSSLGDINNRHIPLILTQSDWIEEVRLSTMTRSLIRAISVGKLETRQKWTATPGRVSQFLNVDLGHAYHLLNIEKGHDSFFREIGGATTLANATKAIGPALRRVNAEQRRRNNIRYLQERVSLLSADSKEITATDVSSFTSAMPHRIDVRIGPSADGWTDTTDPFAFQDLPRRKGGHLLTVVFTEPTISTRPQVEHILLPPYGPSSECAFYLIPNPNHRSVQARISVLYENRVLQTSILEGKIIGEGERAKENATISFKPEVVVSPGMLDLDQQGSFGAALIMNHSANGAQVTKIVNDSAELISVSNLSDWIKNIEDRLDRSDWGAKDMQSIDGAGTLDLLRFLAAHGSLLYNGIVNRQFEDQALKAAKRIQLIAAKEGSRLPVEYFYELSSPKEDAKLCPSAKEALSGGKCPADCPTRKDQRSYVCPLGFWGLNRVLEWHVYRPASAKEVGNRDYALQEEKIASRKQLDVTRQALVGASSRADAEVRNSVATLEQRIKKSGVPLQPANTWTKWEDNVKKYGPSMLILIPHTDKDARNIQQLEIGKAQWLPLDQLDQRYVGDDKAHPVVFLLGCETAKQKASFEDFVSNFASYGAAIVVASSTVVLGRQATVVAAEFVTTLKRMSKLKNKTFGDVMLAVRQTMLTRGFPMIMSVSAYGDADWRI